MASSGDSMRKKMSFFSTHQFAPSNGVQILRILSFPQFSSPILTLHDSHCEPLFFAKIRESERFIVLFYICMFASLNDAFPLFLTSTIPTGDQIIISPLISDAFLHETRSLSNGIQFT